MTERNTPIEFTAEHIEQQCGEDAYTPGRSFMECGEPYKSLFANNPSMAPLAPDEPLQWGKGLYFDTTVGRKHPYWKDKGVPAATKDIQQLRHDLKEWGYCLVEDGLSPEQVDVLYKRLDEQAAAERKAELMQFSNALQPIWALQNKGDCLVKVMEFDPQGVQGGLLVEQIVTETLGDTWTFYSAVALLAYPGCHPQVLHQDQTFQHPVMIEEIPLQMNILYLLEDVNEVNGGTLIIPGSHKLMAAAGSGGQVGKMPPAINLEGKAGTVLITDGRTLHGTGANRSDKFRMVLSNSVAKSWVRPQENFYIETKPEVLRNASPKLLQRLGYQAKVIESVTDGFGSTGTGHHGDPSGATVEFALALNRGDYVRVEELTEEMVDTYAGPEWTVKKVRKQALCTIKELSETDADGEIDMAKFM